MLKVIPRAKPRADHAEKYYPPVISVIGLDTTTVPVNTLCCVAEECRPIPVDELSFHTLSEFCHYWNLNLAGRGLRIAVPAGGPDSLGVRTWLEVQGEQLERYDLTGYRHHLGCDFLNLGLEDHFVRAYVLALYALYRYRAPRVARDVWAKLFEAHYLLEDLRHEMHRLSMAFPEPPDPEDIPF